MALLHQKKKTHVPLCLYTRKREKEAQGFSRQAIKSGKDVGVCRACCAGLLLTAAALSKSLDVRSPLAGRPATGSGHGLGMCALSHSLHIPSHSPFANPTVLFLLFTVCLSLYLARSFASPAGCLRLAGPGP